MSVHRTKIRQQPSSSRQNIELHKWIYGKHGGDGQRGPLTPSPFPVPWPCRLAIETPPRPGSPCRASHFMSWERLMFSNLTSSELLLFPASMVSDNMLSAPTPPLSYTAPLSSYSILALHLYQCWRLQGLSPATFPHVVAFESWTRCWALLQSVLTACNLDSISLLLDHGTWTQSLNLCVCLYFSLFYLGFSDRNSFYSASLYAILSLSSQRFHPHNYSHWNIVSWQCETYWTILLLLLAFYVHVTSLVCSFYSNFARNPAFTFLQYY